jgi:thiamine-monophosphate kinase
MAAALTLSDLGEDAVLRKLLELLPDASSEVLVGPGDDCAVVQVEGSPLCSLLKADSVVEGVHFLSGEKMQRVGWKAMCRAVSDIAAMGGRPRHALVTIAASPLTPLEELRELYRGLAKAASTYGVSVVGGETGKTLGALVCSVFLTGVVERSRCLLRSGGRPGDRLYVTGRLGGSLQSGRHLDFEPRLEEACWLAERRCVSAMMDISDGLGADAPRMARASGCGLKIDPALVPCHPGCGVREAFNDGEDFELLLAVPCERAEALEHGWSSRFLDVPLTQIGCLCEAGAGFEPEEFFKQGGYNHFQ